MSRRITDDKKYKHIMEDDIGGVSPTGSSTLFCAVLLLFHP